MWRIERYSPEKKMEWDGFVADARNSTFLFHRDYMDYHADRFSDHSLMAYRKDKLAAVLPANLIGNELYSHQGLTYGGWVLAPSGLDATEIHTLWTSWLRYCEGIGIDSITYKPLPYIYAEMPSQEDLYMLFLCGASLIQTDISSAIDLESNPGFDKLQRRHLKKGISEFEIRECAPEEFHIMLTECLDRRHHRAPVHTLEELKLLKSRFPEDIRLWGSFNIRKGQLLAGVCVYETGICAHCQYIASTQEGRARNALTPLFFRLINGYEEFGFRYFDFGISNEEGGRLLNPGLNRQKTSLGGSGVAYSRYKIDVRNSLQKLQEPLWPEA